MDEIGYTTPTLAIFNSVCKRFNLSLTKDHFNMYKTKTVVYLNSTYSNTAYATRRNMKLQSGLDFNLYYKCLK